MPDMRGCVGKLQIIHYDMHEMYDMMVWWYVGNMWTVHKLATVQVAGHALVAYHQPPLEQHTVLLSVTYMHTSTCHKATCYTATYHTATCWTTNKFSATCYTALEHHYINVINLNTGWITFKERIWSIYGAYMHIWSIYGTYMEHAWKPKAWLALVRSSF